MIVFSKVWLCHSLQSSPCYVLCQPAPGLAQCVIPPEKSCSSISFSPGQSIAHLCCSKKNVHTPPHRINFWFESHPSGNSSLAFILFFKKFWLLGPPPPPLNFQFSDIFWNRKMQSSVSVQVGVYHYLKTFCMIISRLTMLLNWHDGVCIWSQQTTLTLKVVMTLTWSRETTADMFWNIAGHLWPIWRNWKSSRERPGGLEVKN